jgi:hypothetical protein
MSDPLSARITFGLAEEPEQLQFHTTSSDNPWRLLADDTAVELVPVCNALGQTVVKPPLADQLEIWPVHQGFPPSLIKDHPDEVEKMRVDHHAGLHDLINCNLMWNSWLNECGIFELWLRHSTPEMGRRWLNCDNVICDGTTVFKLDGESERNGFPRIRRAHLDRIRFRADYSTGEKCQTIYLAECIKSPLTTEERELSPGRAAREDEAIRKRTNLEEAATKNIALGTAVAAQLSAAAKEVKKSSEVADLYANPSIADAKNAAILKHAPKEFVHYCLVEKHVRKFPSTGEAFKAVQSLPLFRALRDPDAPSRATVGRWLRLVRTELEKRGQLQSRTTGPAAGKAAHYDIEKHPAPPIETTTLDDLEEDQKRGGKTAPNPGGDLDPNDLNSDEMQADE